MSREIRNMTFTLVVLLYDWIIFLSEWQIMKLFKSSCTMTTNSWNVCFSLKIIFSLKFLSMQFFYCFIATFAQTHLSMRFLFITLLLFVMFQNTCWWISLFTTPFRKPHVGCQMFMIWKIFFEDRAKQKQIRACKSSKRVQFYR